MTGKTNMIVLWVASVGNKYGVNSYVAVSEDALRDEILEYVKEWWQKELGDLPMPQDRDRAIEAYFEKVENETCVIDSTTLAGVFEDLFHSLPGNKAQGGYLELGEWNPVTETYPWEGYVDLILAPGDQVWAKVGQVDDIPELEDQTE